MDRIVCVRPKVSRQEAVRQFRRRGLLGLGAAFRSLRMGPLRSVADAYVPYRVYEVEIKDGPRKEKRLLALDAVSGSLDLYGFERLPDASETVQIETRNHPQPDLEENRAQTILADKVRRLIFQAGFFRLRNLHIHSQRLDCQLYIPYWIGFYGARQRARLAVLDAVRNQIEGARARLFFEAWLSS